MVEIGKGKKETLYFFILNVFSKVLTYILLFIFSRYFITSNFGAASFVFTAFQFVFAIAFIGMPDVFIPWIIKKKDVHSVFYLNASLTLFFFIAGLIISIFQPWILPLVLVLPVLLFGSIGRSFIQAKHKHHYIQLLDLAFLLLAAIGSLVFKDLDKAGILIAYAIAYSVTGLAAFLKVKSDVISVVKKFVFKIIEIKEYLKKSLVSFVLANSFALLGGADLLVLGIITNTSSVANYYIAFSLANIITIVPLSFSMFLLPRISEIKDNLLARSLLRRIIRLSYSMTLILAITVISIISLILKIFFPEYISIDLYITLIMTGYLFYGIYAFLIYNYVSGRLNPEKLLFIIIFTALFNLALDVVLISFFGLLGISLASLISNLVGSFLVLKKIRLIKEFFPFYILGALIPLSFYLKLYGLTLIPLAILLMILIKIIRIKDLKVVIEVIANSRVNILKK